MSKIWTSASFFQTQILNHGGQLLPLITWKETLVINFWLSILTSARAFCLYLNSTWWGILITGWFWFWWQCGKWYTYKPCRLDAVVASSHILCLWSWYKCKNPQKENSIRSWLTQIFVFAEIFRYFWGSLHHPEKWCNCLKINSLCKYI